MADDDLTLRPATGADAAAMAGVWLRSFSVALPQVRRAHNDTEVRAWFADVIVPHRRSWVATTSNDVVVGLLVLDDTEIDQLYLEPSWRGQGLGDRFIDLAKHQSPRYLGLWTFHINQPAQRFYRRHGFRATDRTDGRRNEEHEPDVRYVWQPGPARSGR